MNIVKRNKPFVKTFVTPYGKYMYEVNRNKVINISDNVYEMLKNEKINWEDPEIRSLHETGYLLSYYPLDIEHPQTCIVDTLLNSKLKGITLQLTQACNFRCSYCVYSEGNSMSQRNHTTKKMSWDIAKKAVDFLIEHSKDQSHVNISFYGGEPLLEFSIIKSVIEYVSQNYNEKNVTYNMTTNGALLDDDKLAFFERNKVKIMISIDGPKNIHDRCRVFAGNGKGTYKVVEEKINRIREKYPYLLNTLTFSAVVDPQYDLKDINEFFTYFRKNDRVITNFSLVSESYQNDVKYFSEKYQTYEKNERIKTLLSILGFLETPYQTSISDQYIQSISKFENKLKKTYSFNFNTAPAGPCVPGLIRLLIDVDGQFFPCEHVSETSEIMKIGSIDIGFDIKRIIELLNVSKLTLEHCKECWAFHSCYQCARFCDDIKNMNAGMRLRECNKMRWSVEKQIETYIIIHKLMEIKNEYTGNRECCDISIRL